MNLIEQDLLEYSRDEFWNCFDNKEGKEVIVKNLDVWSDNGVWVDRNYNKCILDHIVLHIYTLNNKSERIGVNYVKIKSNSIEFIKGGSEKLYFNNNQIKTILKIQKECEYSEMGYVPTYETN